MSERPIFAPAALRRRRRILRGLAVLLLAGPIVYLGLFQIARGQFRSMNLRALRTGDGATAKQAAWWVADHGRIQYAAVIREALQRPEISDDYREALVYTVGRLEDADAAPALREVLDNSDSGVVRQAAWVALARISASIFRTTVQERAARDVWDELGFAQGRLYIGETGAVAAVLRIAGEGDINQRQIACRAITRVIRPILEAAGRWPAAFDPRPGDIWALDQIDLVAGRIRTVDLAAVAEGTLRHAEAAGGVQKNVRRLASGSDHIARLLFWRSRSNAPGQSDEH